MFWITWKSIIKVLNLLNIPCLNSLYLQEVVQLVIAVEWTHDQLSPLNIVGLVSCLCGISFHVFHKIKNQPMRPPHRPYESHHEGHEIKEYLINDYTHESPSESEEDRSDTDVLFDILKRRER